MDEVKQTLNSCVKAVFNVDTKAQLSRVDEQFGDYASNVAMQLAKQLQKPPKEIADELTANLKSQADSDIKEVSVAGPGFINIRMQDAWLVRQLNNPNIDQKYAGKTVVAEYSDPNPFKILHAGHLYTSVVGDALSRLYEAAGAKVHRVNYGGDVGLHVGKTLWAMIQKLGGENPAELDKIPSGNRAEWMADAYVTGSNAYEDDPAAKQAIIELNKKVYAIHANNDRSSDLAKIYWTTRQWSYDYFDEFYKRIGSNFEKYYPESEVAERGLQAVREQLKKGVFKESDGAVVFAGDKHDLHTRVFINAIGLPTYEAKDVGLILTKWQDFKFNVSLIITGNEQAQYMKVVLKALEQFEPELAKHTVHLTHGLVKLKGGQKMSSRKGNILRAVDVLDVSAEANRKISGKAQPEVELAAVKYAFLKQGLGADIIYDPEESVAISGNSGPYLQYSHARAKSILAKAKPSNTELNDLTDGERSLARKISEYAESVNEAINELKPHVVANYLYELAQVFNRFYETNKVIGDPREAQRLKLVETYATTLKNSLALLNITAPESM